MKIILGLQSSSGAGGEDTDFRILKSPSFFFFFLYKKQPFQASIWLPIVSPKPGLCKFSQPRPLSSQPPLQDGPDPASSLQNPSKKESRPGEALVFSFHTSSLFKKASVLLLGWLPVSVQGPDRIFLFAQRRGCLSISATSGGGLSGLLITVFSPASLPSLTACYAS